MQHTFSLTTDYIELNKLLKFYSVGESGGQVKQLISQGKIYVNGQQELRARNKMKVGDEVTYADDEVTIVVENGM